MDVAGAWAAHRNPAFVGLLGVLALASLGGCMAARGRVDGDIVRRLRFVGNSDWIASGNNDQVLRGQMVQEGSPAGTFTFPFSLIVQPATLHPELLGRDARSVEVFLAEAGWYEAKLSRWEVIHRHDPAPGRAGVVDLVGHVDLGPVTLVDPAGPVFAWEGEAPAQAPALFALSPRGGSRFDLRAARRSAEAMEAFLRERGHAGAEVEVHATMQRAQRLARLEFTVRAGPSVRFGELRVHGVGDPWTEGVLRERAPFAAGEPYTSAALDRYTADIFALGAWSTVTARPDLAAIEAGAVPIDLRVAPAPPRYGEAVARVDVAGSLILPEVSLTVGHQDLGGRLVQGRATLDAGAVIDLGSTEPIAVYGLSVDAQAPRVLLPGLDARAGAEARRDLFEAQLPRDRAAVDASLGLRLGRGGRVEAGPAIEAVAVEAPTTASEQSLEAVALGLGFDPYVITPLDAEIEWDARRGDEPGVTLNGWRGAVRWRRALPSLDPVAYDDGAVDLGAWWTPGDPRTGLSRRTTLAARLALRAQWDRGGAPIPYAERVFLGGGASLRGFREGQVGPYDCVCTVRDPTLEVYGEDDVARRYLPWGGAASALLTVEARVAEVVVPEASVAVFADAGALADDLPGLAEPGQLRWDVGAGLRYATPVGPLRIDLTARPLYPEDEGPAFGAAGSADRGVYAGCDEVGARRRAFDLLSEFGRTEPLDRTVPALNVFLTLGEAF